MAKSGIVSQNHPIGCSIKFSHKLFSIETKGQNVVRTVVQSNMQFKFISSAIKRKAIVDNEDKHLLLFQSFENFTFFTLLILFWIFL